MRPERPSLWRTDARTLLRLLAGLWIFGTGEALLVLATLGNSPWTVLAEGVSEQAGAGIGFWTIVISFLVLLAWIPLRQRPGLGTILNAIVIGVAIAITLDLVGRPDQIGVRLGLVVVAISMVGVGSGLYLTSRLGPGPRDGCARRRRSARQCPASRRPRSWPRARRAEGLGR